jgi:beta-glucanase (GH16 family)
MAWYVFSLIHHLHPFLILLQWPYSYDACDVGTAPNQTRDGLPIAATVNGDKHRGGVLSYLPGQRLSRCTCQGESHPGPVHQDGTYVGRAAPEIDLFEAQISAFTTGAPLSGQVSMSAQWAVSLLRMHELVELTVDASQPFNAGYDWFNTSANLIIPDPNTTKMNLYTGSALQQATSGVVLTGSLRFI